MSRKCFVMMPFDPSFNGAWEHVLRPTVTAVGDECKRADDFFNPAPIINDVRGSIRNADYLIADLTGKNANVFYELRIAHALGKPVILLAQQIQDVPLSICATSDSSPMTTPSAGPPSSWQRSGAFSRSSPESVPRSSDPPTMPAR
jgi:hypothetical protein